MAIVWNRQVEINTILDFLLSPLTSCEWENNRLEQIGRDQHHSQFPNDNQTAYFLQ